MKTLILISALLLLNINNVFANDKPTLVDSFALSIVDMSAEIRHSENPLGLNDESVTRKQNSPREISSMKVQVSQWSNGETVVEGSGLTSSLDQPVTFDYQINLESKTIEVSLPTELGYVRQQQIDESKTHFGDDTIETIEGESIEVETSTDGFSKKQIKDVQKALRKNSNVRDAAVSLSPDLYDTKESLATTLSSSAIRPGWHYRGVMVTTLDPPPFNVQLTRTGTSTLWCVYPSGLQNWFQATRRNWAANPSRLFNTHWFVASIFFNSPRPNYWTTSPLRSFNNASYYNDDFLFDNLRTNVTQVVNLAARNDGVAAYSWRHADSGEGHVYIRGSLSFY